MTDPVKEEAQSLDDEVFAEGEGPETASEAGTGEPVEEATGSADAQGMADDDDGTDAEPDGVGDLAHLQKEFDTLNDRHLRLAAEFNNFRRRSEQERLGAWSRAQADLLEKLLDVLDDLQRVADLDLENATVEAIMEGIDLVERKFIRQLGDSGVEVIDPSGEPFDPESMEAMMRVPAQEDAQADTVAQVFQKGYSLKGILIRPARVSVYTQG